MIYAPRSTSSDYYKLPLGQLLPISIIIIMLQQKYGLLDETFTKEVIVQCSQNINMEKLKFRYDNLYQYKSLLYFDVFDYYLTPFFAIQKMINFPNQNSSKPSITKKHKRDKRALKRIIDDLVRRREQHEERINKLLEIQYHHQEKTKSSPRGGHQEFSEVLRNLQIDQSHNMQEYIGGLGNHVNLLATVSLKTDYFLMQQQHPREEGGQLYTSLRNAYGKKKILYEFDGQQPQDTPEWLKILVRFLIDSELINGLFVMEGNQEIYDFYGTLFRYGKYQQVILSKNELKQTQKKLIITSRREKIETINISWLLLTRLLKPLQQLNFPLSVHKLFSFPYKKFNISESLQLINLTQYVEQMHSSQALNVYGIEQHGKCYEISIEQFKGFKDYLPMIHRFKNVLLMNQIEYPSKSLPLSCLKNHFVVATMNLKGKGQYYISVGEQSSKMRFRMCILDFQGNIVQYQIINSGQFMLSQLNDQQYELYICPESTRQEEQVLGEDESYELVREIQEHFLLWVQGPCVCTKQGDLQLQIRLKEQYSSYTLKIAKQYIRLRENSEPTQFPSQQNSIFVKRLMISSLNLVVDQFVTSHNRKLNIKYEQANICDQFFQDKVINVSTNQCVALRKPTNIEKIEFVNINTQVSFKFFITYI